MAECTKCGYSKSGLSADRIRICVDCGTVWPTQPKTDAADNWRLNRVDEVEHTQDDSGIYVYINWDVKTESARLDVMTEQTASPLQSFAGTADNVRKHAIKWLSDNANFSDGKTPGFGPISTEHASYIGFELCKADAERIDYVQS